MARVSLWTNAFTVLNLIIMLPHTVAQEYPGCFWINPKTGQYESLEHLCPLPEEAEPEPDPFQVQLVEGLELSGLALEDDANQRFIVGLLTNKTERTIKVQSIGVQFLDKRTDTVIQFTTVNLGGTIAPGQSYEFRRILNDVLELGGRRNKDLSIKFLEWD